MKYANFDNGSSKKLTVQHYLRPEFPNPFLVEPYTLGKHRMESQPTLKAAKAKIHNSALCIVYDKDEKIQGILTFNIPLRKSGFMQA
jgi:hypothetical protein